MTLDGIIAGAAVFGGGVLLGYWLNESHHTRMELLRDEFGRIAGRHAARAEALEQHIRDMGKEATAEDLGYGSE
jgi:hypothetical protein